MKNYSPKISVIMAVYNENLIFLQKAIKSILNQTYKNFEFLVINDNSNDQTTALLKKYARQDQRIILIKNKKNIGLTKSLNVGIKKSYGKYIARMDSDDISLPDRLQSQLNFILDKNSNNYDLITSDCILIDNTGKKIKFKKTRIEPNIKKQLIKGNIFIHSTFFGKREVFKELYNEKFKKAQDYEFLLRIASQGYTIGNLPRVYLKYRINNMSISFRSSKEQEWSAIKARWIALKKYDYNKLYFIYLLRALVVFAIPHKLKLFLLQ